MTIPSTVPSVASLRSFMMTMLRHESTVGGIALFAPHHVDAGQWYVSYGTQALLAALDVMLAYEADVVSSQQSHALPIRLPIAVDFHHDMLLRGYRQSRNYREALTTVTNSLPQVLKESLQRIGREQMRKHLGSVLDTAWQRRSADHGNRQAQHDDVASAMVLREWQPILKDDEERHAFIANWAAEHLRRLEAEAQKTTFLQPSKQAFNTDWLAEQQEQARTWLYKATAFRAIVETWQEQQGRTHTPLAFWHFLTDFLEQKPQHVVRHAFLAGNEKGDCRLGEHTSSFLAHRRRAWQQLFSDGECLDGIHKRYRAMQQRFLSVLGEKYPFSPSDKELSSAEIRTFFAWARKEIDFLQSVEDDMPLLSAEKRDFLTQLTSLEQKLSFFLQVPVAVRIDLGQLGRERHIGDFWRFGFRIGDSAAFSPLRDFRWRSGDSIGFALQWKKDSRWLPIAGKGGLVRHPSSIIFRTDGAWALLRFYETHRVMAQGDNILGFSIDLGLADAQASSQQHSMLPRRLDVMMRMDTTDFSLSSFLADCRAVVAEVRQALAPEKRDSLAVLD